MRLGRRRKKAKIFRYLSPLSTEKEEKGSKVQSHPSTLRSQAEKKVDIYLLIDSLCFILLFPRLSSYANLSFFPLFPSSPLLSSNRRYRLLSLHFSIFLSYFPFNTSFIFSSLLPRPPTSSLPTSFSSLLQQYYTDEQIYYFMSSTLLYTSTKFCTTHYPSLEQ